MKFKVGDKVRSISNYVWSKEVMVILEINGYIIICSHPTQGQGGFHPKDLKHDNKSINIAKVNEYLGIK